MYQATEQARNASSTTANGTLGACPEWPNRRASEQATRAAKARRTSSRRRRVDPTTCDRDYSERREATE